MTIQDTCATTLSLNGGVDLINKDGNSSYNVGADNTVDVSLVTLPISLVIDESQITYDGTLCGPLVVTSSLSDASADVTLDTSDLTDMKFEIGTGMQPTSANSYKTTVIVTLTAS